MRKRNGNENRKESWNESLFQISLKKFKLYVIKLLPH